MIKKRIKKMIFMNTLIEKCHEYQNKILRPSSDLLIIQNRKYSKCA